MRRRSRNRPVGVRGARDHSCLLWALGELACVAFDRDVAARSCTAIPFHALPKVPPDFAVRLRHPPTNELLQELL